MKKKPSLVLATFLSAVMMFAAFGCAQSSSTSSESSQNASDAEQVNVSEQQVNEPEGSTYSEDGVTLSNVRLELIDEMYDNGSGKLDPTDFKAAWFVEMTATNTNEYSVDVSPTFSADITGTYKDGISTTKHVSNGRLASMVVRLPYPIVLAPGETKDAELFIPSEYTSSFKSGVTVDSFQIDGAGVSKIGRYNGNKGGYISADDPGLSYEIDEAGISISLKNNTDETWTLVDVAFEGKDVKGLSRTYGQACSRSTVAPGDIVSFNSTEAPDHVGLTDIKPLYIRYECID